MSQRGACAVFLLGLLGGCRDGAAPPAIERGDLDVRLGVAGAQPPGVWNVLRVAVRNRGALFDGAIEVRGCAGPGGEFPEAALYRHPLELAPATAKEVAIPVRPRGWTSLELSLRAPGFARSFTIEDLNAAPSAALRVLAIGSRPRDLVALKAWLAARLVASAPGGAETGAGGDSPLVAIDPADPGKLPALATAYDPYHLVLISAAAVAEATHEALAALAEWARRGGTLAAFGLSGGGAGTAERFERFFNGVDRGAGRVLVLPVEPGALVLPAPAEAPAVYRMLEAAVARAVSFSGDAAAGLREVEEELPKTLLGMTRFRVPSRAAITGGLALYVLVGFLAPAWLCSRLGRREWTFAAIALAAVLAGSGVYRLGLLSALDAAEVEEVSIVRVHADRKSAEATSYLGLISPRPMRVSLDVAGEGALPSLLPLGSDGRGRGLVPPGATLEASAGGRLRLEPLLLRPHAMQYVRIDHRVSIEGLAEYGPERRAPGAALRVVTAITHRLGELVNRRRDRFPASGPGREPFCRVVTHAASVLPDIPGLRRGRSLTVLMIEVPGWP